MSEGWTETCTRILEQIEKMAEKKDKDRLDIVQSMRFSLYALHRSILGWLNWVNNPDIMVSFNPEELEAMNKKIIGFIEDFIKYDIEVTQKGEGKTVVAQKARREAEEKARRSPDDIFYI
jgi:hypothetical protein